MEERFLVLGLIFPQNLSIDFHAIIAFYCLYPLSIFHSMFLMTMQRDPLVRAHKKYESKHELILDIYSLIRIIQYSFRLIEYPDLIFYNLNLVYSQIIHSFLL